MNSKTTAIIKTLTGHFNEALNILFLTRGIEYFFFKAAKEDRNLINGKIASKCFATYTIKADSMFTSKPSFSFVINDLPIIVMNVGKDAELIALLILKHQNDSKRNR